jgi:hypothetical protein
MRYRQILAAAVLCACVVGAATAQVAKRRAVSKGPRALGLIEVDDKGAGRLVPIAIMIDGRFYDAGVYKADPIPMALQPGTVYEGVKSGVPQGLFTVNNPLPHNGWIGFGSWKTNGQIASEKDKAKARAETLAAKPADDLKAGGPPRLSRTPEGAHPKPAVVAPGKTADAPDHPVLKKSTPTVEASAPIDDSSRPVLRRQTEGAAQQVKSVPATELKRAPMQQIPAISDAEGPQPRPYTYQTKPEEDADFMKKMGAMAADELKHRFEAAPGNETKTKAGRAATPELREAKLKVLDISGTNEAVLIYSATVNAPGRADLQFSVTVVARQDIYADLHKIFAHITDNQHLDVQPRYEFVDAVDADGDGRGELLFRQVGESGSATGFALYRVIGDQLWPLFETKPGS